MPLMAFFRGVAVRCHQASEIDYSFIACSLVKMLQDVIVCEELLFQKKKAF